MEREIDGEILTIPQHVAIILDGNGRWAKKRMMPRSYGHKAGAQTVEDVCEFAGELGIRYLTVYAFSTENWKRSTEEVSFIMNLLRNHLKNSLERAAKNNMQIRVIGDKSALDKDIIDVITDLEEKTRGNTRLTFTIALNYGGRDEIRRAVQHIVRDAEDGKIVAEDISENTIASYLDTHDMPDPDLLIRTSGEQRISNYLLWQIAYSEFYFTPVLWPDFGKEDLIDAIKYYNSRDRRFGGVK